MVPYNFFTRYALDDDSTAVEVANFVKRVLSMRDAIVVSSLVVTDLRTEPVNLGCDDPEVMSTPPGRRYIVELSGGLNRTDQPDFGARLWMTFTVFSAYADVPVQLQLDVLHVGVVNTKLMSGSVCEITRANPTPPSEMRSSFPAEWCELVAERGMALALAA